MHGKCEEFCEAVLTTSHMRMHAGILRHAQLHGSAATPSDPFSKSPITSSHTSHKSVFTPCDVRARHEIIKRNRVCAATLHVRRTARVI